MEERERGPSIELERLHVVFVPLTSCLFPLLVQEILVFSYLDWQDRSADIS